jgi:malonate transporter
VAAVIVVLLLGMTALVVRVATVVGVDGPAFSSVYQGAIRFNTYVGLAVALAVFHAEGGTVAALVMAIMIPLINVLCVLVLNVHAGGSAPCDGVLRGLIANPLILACLTRHRLEPERDRPAVGLGGGAGDSGAGGAAAGICWRWGAGLRLAALAPAGIAGRRPAR